MSSVHSGNPATFTSAMALMTDSDEPTAALFRNPLEKLLDNDAYLQAKTAAASDTFAGLIEIATQAEVAALTDTTRAVTPGRLPIAADAQQGLIEIATQAEQEAGTDTTRAVTPGRQHYHQSAAKFWAYVTVSGGTPTLATSYNVTSITDNSTGNLTVTIATDFSSASWSCVATARASLLGRCVQVSSQAAGSVTVICFASDTVNNTDPDAWSVVGYGDQ